MYTCEDFYVPAAVEYPLRLGTHKDPNERVANSHILTDWPIIGWSYLVFNTLHSVTQEFLSS